jgi:hypothetical protein
VTTQRPSGAQPAEMSAEQPVEQPLRGELFDKTAMSTA